MLKFLKESGQAFALSGAIFCLIYWTLQLIFN
jgi:hypothetical protein